MIQKTIEDWIEKNHIPTVNVEGYLMVSKEDLTKLLVKYKTEQLIIADVVGRSEQLICDTCKSGLIDYPDINRRTCRCGGLGYNVTD